MQREKKFEKTGMSIIIPLNYKGYVVRANIMRTEVIGRFTITYELSCKEYPLFSVIEGDMFTLTSDKDINVAVYRFTMDKFAEGYFKPFIDRYDFEMNAMNRGIEIIESNENKFEHLSCICNCLIDICKKYAQTNLELKKELENVLVKNENLNIVVSEGRCIS